MKKLFTTMTSLLLLTTLLAACLPGAGAADAPEITLSFWGWEASALESAAIQNGIDNFEAANPGIKVDYMVSPFGEYHTKLRNAMNAGEAPDVFYLHPDYQRDFINAGLLLELTDIITEYVDLDDLVPASKEKVSVTDADGNVHYYGMDVCNVGPVMYYNKDLFDAAGVEYMPTKVEDQWTWDEFVANMQKLTKTEDGVTQYGTYNWEEGFNMYVLQYALRSNGAEWFNADISEAINVDSPATRKTFEQIKSLRTEYGVAPDPTAVGMETTHSPTQMFLTGQVATLALGSYALQEISQSDINYGVGLLPKFDGDNVMIASADLKGIWVDTPNQEAALKLLAFMSSETEFGVPIYKTGLWMPNRLSMYEEENLELWFDRTIYPEGYEDLLDMFKNANGRWVDKFTNTDAIYDAVGEQIEAYYYLDASLDEVLPAIQEGINSKLSR